MPSARNFGRRGRRGVTAADLAGRFEVSIRTVKRDVSALQQSGMPIWAQSGVGGGYFLAETADLPPINFTPTQAAAVSLALAALPDGSPFAADIRAASAKILDVLSDTDRAKATSLARRLWVMSPETNSTNRRRDTPCDRDLARRATGAVDRLQSGRRDPDPK